MNFTSDFLLMDEVSVKCTLEFWCEVEPPPTPTPAVVPSLMEFTRYGKNSPQGFQPGGDRCTEHSSTRITELPQAEPTNTEAQPSSGGREFRLDICKGI